MRKKEIVHQFNSLSKIPTRWGKYWVEFLPDLSLDGIFMIDGKEVIVRRGDYLVEYKNRLYYYPKDIYEAKANRYFVSKREDK